MAKQRGRKLLQKQNKDDFKHSLDQERHEEEVIQVPVDKAPAPISADGPNTFFGTLDTQELEYFKRAESTMAVDTFESADEKYQFINSVIEESKGKELKLATSQICSKLMERIILAADDQQLKAIFQGINGFFVNLSYNKYASHVVETLLVRSAALIEKELLTPVFEAELDGDEQVYASMENMFLFMLNELKPHMKMMINHQYASHVFRLLILVLSAKKLPKSTQSNSALRSKKSKIARKMVDLKDNADFDRTYRTPDSFKLELKGILVMLYKQFTNGIEPGTKHSEVNIACVTKFREYCVDKVASPVIQLIIQVEGIFDRDRSFWNLVFSNTEQNDPKEESFMEYLLSDSVGSHFLQAVIGFARTKQVERLYKLYMQDRIVKLAKRDTTGAFVIMSLLQNLGSKEVKSILDDLVPELSILLNSNLDFGSEIIEASIRQGDYKKTEIVEQLGKKYYPADSESKNILESCLQLASSTLGNTKDDWPTADERRRALFLEKLINFDDYFLEIAVESLLNLPEERIMQMCYHGVFSHVVEHVLQAKRVETVKRKLLLNILYKDAVNLACNAYGSHIMDKLWEFTAKLTLYKERIANLLLEEADKVKNSIYGRQVWKNWHLELYVRKRFDWRKKVKEQELEVFPDSKPLQPKQKESIPAKRSAPSNNQRPGSLNKKRNAEKHHT
ncbi:ACR046Wp [Eremothecium gossypii ATCC 10895]|uniref:Nucleolar protein 9 n=1 Tax=Eremothecium gossypii (strain ATCC 10895 / CBS 109.51 / FGSC 9923 / NRRL Y-1056) TaxID=284811 RepID=NOP9_EREGS|nr:ACR046Wp [Eremothecium gossypii ATCC 10895]Q75C70.2 RecName: Full=Nucleolar protein 9; AltName: Full=Pumilio domain-containing protein NOP9 [Eremothecium gossypii ATCC 10895]AAS51273.2 ACR046Wp [Eremothecium gossypii ATCC 10895]AEY95564.1 FACR046Wp [Eremothecium gossypii FDAG1]